MCLNTSFVCIFSMLRIISVLLSLSLSLLAFFFWRRLVRHVQFFFVPFSHNHLYAEKLGETGQLMPIAALIYQKKKEERKKWTNAKCNRHLGRRSGVRRGGGGKCGQVKGQYCVATNGRPVGSAAAAAQNRCE